MAVENSDHLPAHMNTHFEDRTAEARDAEEPAVLAAVGKGNVERLAQVLNDLGLVYKAEARQDRHAGAAVACFAVVHIGGKGDFRITVAAIGKLVKDCALAVAFGAIG